MALTRGLQEEAGGLGELAVFRIAKGVDGSGAEAVVPAGVWLEGNLDWLAMGSGWKLGLCGERNRPVGGTGSMQSGWGGFGRYVTAGIPTTSLLALRLKHSESTSQHHLASLLR